MSKKTRAERNLRFETLQLHVGQEHPDPPPEQEQYRFTRHLRMYLTTATMRRRDLDCRMQGIFTED